MNVYIDIDVEIEKLGKFVNINEILRFEDYEIHYEPLEPCTKVKYLLYVLQLTQDNPKIEMYLEQLLENYSTTILNDLDADSSGFTILHFMVLKLYNISLNSFDTIMKFGIDVNSQNEEEDTPLHLLWLTNLSEHAQNVIGLFVEYGADLNILNYNRRTVLDEIMVGDDEDTRIIIMLLIDFGAKINNPFPDINVKVLEFIESYRSSSIKPAIKNEIKI